MTSEADPTPFQETPNSIQKTSILQKKSNQIEFNKHDIKIRANIK